MTSGALLVTVCLLGREYVNAWNILKHYLIKFFEEMNNCSASVLTDYPAWTPLNICTDPSLFFELGSNSMASYGLFQFLSLTLAKSAQLLSSAQHNLSCSKQSHIYVSNFLLRLLIMRDASDCCCSTC